MFSQKGGNGRNKILNKWTTETRQKKWNLLLSMMTIFLLLNPCDNVSIKVAIYHGKYSINPAKSPIYAPTSSMHSTHFSVNRNMDEKEQTTLLSPVNWSNSLNSNNKLNHIINGNKRRIGYIIGFWNCRKKLIGGSNHDTNKLTDIKTYVTKHSPHVFGIIESNLHGNNSLINKNKKYSTEEVKQKLNIEGYSLILPSSWSSHGQARVVAYVKDDIRARVIDDDTNTDLPRRDWIGTREEDPY